AHQFVEFRKKLACELFCRPVDEARADLRHLAADGGIDVIVEERSVRRVAEADIGASLAKSCSAALALTGNCIAVGRIDIAERDLAFETGGDRADLDFHRRRKFGVAQLFNGLATGNAFFKDFRVIESVPDLIARGNDKFFAGHLHELTPTFSYNDSSLLQL